MPSSPDEETLIQAARDERRQHRSGASMAAMLSVAGLFGAIGALLLFLPRVLGAIPLVGGLSGAVGVTLAVVAFAIAGFFLLAALASSPAAAWGSKAPGACPACGDQSLRSDTVPGPASGEQQRGGPRGVVILCEGKGCDYASAKVIRPGASTAG